MPIAVADQKPEERIKMLNAVAEPKTADERLQALARSALNDTLIKYNSGNWTISEVLVPANTRFVIYPDQVTHYWTHFVGGKAVTEIAAVVADDADGDTELHIVAGKERKDLGSDDEAKWETDSSGKLRDPWVYGFGLPMMNAETGALVVFKTASVGGMGAIAGQVASFTRNRHLGRPIVTLSTGSYKNKRFGGYTSFPVFVNAGYEAPPATGIASGRPNGDGGGANARVIGESKVRDREVDAMDDDIPY
jgi:hypothetical protein